MRRSRDYSNGSSHHNPSPGGGPLLTNHLRDLNIELELLKRKRELIQQEQEMLNRYPPGRQYDYEESFYNRREYNQGYSNRFEGPSGSNLRGRGSKRRSPSNQWPSPSQKRFAAPKISPWETSPLRSEGFPNNEPYYQPLAYPQIRPLMGIRPGIGHKLAKNPPPRRDFRPTKVTKPKVQQKKPQLHPLVQEEAKQFASQAIPKTDNILRVDKSPSVQVKGRLELALGTIMKEIKTNHCLTPEDSDIFQTPFIQRILKQTIRARIRNLMLDQPVNHVNDVVHRYRKRFPKESDLDLVQIAREAQTLSSKRVGVVQLIESDDPQEFYKKNMLKAINSKLVQMLSNLENLYLDPKKDVSSIIDKMPEPKQMTEEEITQTTTEVNPLDKDRLTYEKIIGDCDDAKSFSDKLGKVKMYVEFMDILIEHRLPKLLPKFKDMLLSILYTDKEFLNMNAILTLQLRKKLNLFTKDKTKENSLADSKSNDVSLSISAEDSANKDDSNKVEEDTVVVDTAVTNEKNTKTPETTTDKNLNTAQSTTTVEKTAETQSTQEKIVVKQEPPSTPAKSEAKTQDEMLFAKLISKPNLPARAVIYDFLNQFKPTSIKKHKSISNLLVIGFTNKDDYEQFIQINETTIGNSTITIKASEQVNKPRSDTNQGNTPGSADTSLDENIVSPELEQQITDLLSTIREKETESNELLENNKNRTTNSDIQTETTENEKTETAEKENTSKTDNMVTDNESTETGIKKSEESIETKPEAKVSDEKNTSNNDIKSELETIKESDKKEKTPEPVENDKVKELKETVRNTPTRSSSRLANITPSTIRTRRASRLGQNN